MPPGAHNLSARVPTLRWFLALNFFAAFLGIIFRQRTILGIIFSPTDYSTTTLAGSSAEYSAACSPTGDRSWLCRAEFKTAGKAFQHGLDAVARTGTLSRWFRIRSRRGVWRANYTPQLKKRTALQRKLKDVFRRHQSQPVDRVVQLIQPDTVRSRQIVTHDKPYEAMARSHALCLYCNFDKRAP